jgi:hypothetical protein
MSQPANKYPIYIPSKNRADVCLTARFFLVDGVDFRLVVEPSQVAAYRQNYDEKLILVLPRDNMQLLGARLWIREHSIAQGFDRHWQFDDNIYRFDRLYRMKRIPCNANVGIAALEEFTDRYLNIGVSGFNYTMFTKPEYRYPYFLNCHVYSACLINNRMPYKWRLTYNDDTDLCLQVLANRLCTVLFNAFCVNKVQTMAIKGGNTDDLYQDSGRLRMARTLEEMWPQFVKTKWRFKRPQHVVSWSKFRHRLIRRRDLDWPAIEKKQVKLELRRVRPVRSATLEQFMKDYEQPNAKKQRRSSAKTTASSAAPGAQRVGPKGPGNHIAGAGKTAHRSIKRKVFPANSRK